MTDIVVKIKPEDPDNFMWPKQATELAAGFDCYYHGPDQEILPGEWKLIPLQFSMEVPPGYEAQVRPRSGLAKNHGITVLNSPGTIDADYRGPVGAIVINHNLDVKYGLGHIGDKVYTITKGDRVCQIVIAPVPQVRLELAEELSDTERGEGGFGSTGK